MRRGGQIFVWICGLLGAFGGAVVAPQVLQFLFSWMNRSFGSPSAAESYSGAESFFSRAPFAVLGAVLGAFVGAVILRTLHRWLDRWDQMAVGNKATLFIGVLAGFLMSSPFLFLFNATMPGVYIPFAFIGLTLGLSAISVYVLQSMEEYLPWSKSKGRTRRTGIKIFDTNVIIDGRIEQVLRTGFLDGQIYVPGFVLAELQHIADDADPLRRQRGRRGLEILRRIQADFPVEVRVHDRLVSDPGLDVDTRLVRLALALGADVVTNDFNLKRVAQVQDVRVLSLNDLAVALRPDVLPKERLELFVVREGSQYGQGVGYLEDGTMVVVEGGKDAIGSKIDVTISQVIQNDRGRMIFAEPTIEESDPNELPPIRRRNLPRRNGNGG